MSTPKYYVGQHIVFAYDNSESQGMGVVKGAQQHETSWWYQVDVGNEASDTVNESNVQHLLVSAMNKNDTAMMWDNEQDDGASKINTSYK